jgi:hypothetical protein
MADEDFACTGLPPYTTAIVHLCTICPMHSVYSGGTGNVNILAVKQK